MLQSHFSTILLMRLGSTKRIEQCYNTRTLSFGCAANWVDYSKTGDKVTGDQLECVFAHLKNGDSRMNVKDSHGIPMGNHLETLYDPRTDTYYLRFIPTLLTPRLYKISSEGWREAGALLDASFLFYIQFVYSEEIPHKSWKKSLTRNRGLKQKSHRKVGRSRSVEIGLKLKNPTQNFEYPIAG